MSRPVSGPSRSTLLFTLVVAAAVPACDGSDPTEPPGLDTAEVTVSLSVPNFDGIALTSARLEFNRASGAVALDTIVTLPPAAAATLAAQTSGGTATLTFRLPLESDPETFLVEVEFLAGNVAMYRSIAPAALTATAVGGGSVTTPALGYVGPGHGAQTVEVLISGSPATPGSTVTATAVVQNGSGNEVQGVPVSWEALHPSLEVLEVVEVGGRSTASVQVGAQVGVFEVRATLPTAHQASAEITVEALSGTLRLVAELSNYPGVAADALVIFVRRADGVLVEQRTVELDPPAPEASTTAVPVDIVVEVSSPDEDFMVDAHARDATGAELYRTEETLVAHIREPDAGWDVLSLAWVGPGADAHAIELVVPQTPPGLEETVEVQAVVRDAQGDEITEVPLVWSAAGPQVTVVDSGWDQGRSFAVLEFGSSAGTHTVTATAPNGVEAQHAFHLEAPPSQGAFIDFETYPDGSPVCFRCDVSTEWAEMGLTLDFTGAVVPGGKGTPWIDADWFDRSDHWLTNDQVDQTKLTGVIHLNFYTPSSEVRFELRFPSAVGNVEVVALDAAGNPLPTSVVQRAPGTPYGAYTVQDLTLTYAGGIAEVRVIAAGSVVQIDDLYF